MDDDINDSASVISSTSTLLDVKTSSPQPSLHHHNQPSVVDEQRTPMPTPIPEPMPVAETIPKLKMLPPPPAPANEREECAMSNFILASCRLHNAMVFATEVCTDLIWKWSDPSLSADQAVAEAKKVLSMSYAFGSDWKNTSVEAVVLQGVLSATQTMVDGAGAVMGRIVDSRKLAVQQGLLLPIAVLADETERPILTIAQMFSAFTKGTPTDSSIRELTDGLKKEKKACGRAKSYMGSREFKNHEALYKMKQYLDDRRDELEKIRSEVNDLERKRAPAQSRLLTGPERVQAIQQALVSGQALPRAMWDADANADANARTKSVTAEALLKMYREPRFLGYRTTSGEFTSPATNQLRFSALQVNMLFSLAKRLLKKVRRSGTYREKHHPEVPRLSMWRGFVNYISCESEPVIDLNAREQEEDARLEEGLRHSAIAYLFAKGVVQSQEVQSQEVQSQDV